MNFFTKYVSRKIIFHVIHITSI